MEHVPHKDNVVSLRDEARSRLEGQSNMPTSDKLHLLSVLKNHPEVVMHGEKDSIDIGEGRVDVPLGEETEILYYALLLQDPNTPKWDGVGEAPPGPWVNTNHPKVQMAQQRIDTHSLGSTAKEGVILEEVLRNLWDRATSERRSEIITSFLKDSTVVQWYRASGAPEPSEPHLVMDDPNLTRYLSPEWRAYVEEQIERFKQGRTA